MGELGNKLGLDELSGGAAGISKALLAEFIGESISDRPRRIGCLDDLDA